MFNISILKDSLSNLIGYRSQEDFTLDDALTTSTSDIFINDAHPLLSLDVLDSVKPINLSLDDFLLQTRANSIAKTIADVITIKNLAKATKEVLSETQIFDSTASIRNTEAKNGRFVGWIIRPNKANYLNHIIKKVGLQFLEEDTIKLYVFHSSKQDPITTYDLLYTTPRSVQWLDLSTPLILNYQEIDAGGYYYIGYYEDELSIDNQAIYKEHYLDRRPCDGCNPYNFGWYQSWSKYFKINTAVVQAGDDLTDVKNVRMINDRNYGLNFKIVSKCDITDFLIENSELLVYPILYRTAIDLIRYIEMAPTRNNNISDQMSKESFIAINGQVSENNHIKVRGLIHDYDDKIKSLDFNLSRLSPVCLPCSTTGIRWGN